MYILYQTKCLKTMLMLKSGTVLLVSSYNEFAMNITQNIGDFHTLCLMPALFLENFKPNKIFIELLNKINYKFNIIIETICSDQKQNHQLWRQYINDKITQCSTLQPPAFESA